MPEKQNALMRMSVLPSRDEMLRALMEKDPGYEGLFVAGIKTTGIFCRPTCSARKPKPQNVEFFASSQEALIHGYRACKRCRPLVPRQDQPVWVDSLLEQVEQRLEHRWRDRDVRDLGLDPVTVRRWFQRHHGMTFHAYVRARKVGDAMKQMQSGKDVLEAGLDAGYESASGFRDAFHAFFDTTPGKARKESVAGLATVTHITTPLGPMIAGVVKDRLCLLEFGDRRMLQTQCLRVESLYQVRLVPGSHPVLTHIQKELNAYFQGTLRTFTVPLSVKGTPFQERVWNQLLRIPYGKTWSYQEMALEVGTPGGQRAVGKANGDNRLAIIVPCHRVIRSDGSLSGYGGGVWRKQALLDHERGVGRLQF